MYISLIYFSVFLFGFHIRKSLRPSKKKKKQKKIEKISPRPSKNTRRYSGQAGFFRDNFQISLMNETKMCLLSIAQRQTVMSSFTRLDEESCVMV